MNKIKLFTTILVLTALAVSGYFISRRTHFSQTISIDGTEVKVSVYKLPTSLRIKPLYDSRDDLDDYPWLRALLFQLNGFEMTIPQKEWPNYAEGDWPAERYEELVKYNNRLKKSITEQPELWSEVYYGVSEFVLCEIDNVEYLSFCLTAKNSNGDPLGGSRYSRIKRVNGRWVKPLENDESGRIRSRQIANAFDRANQLLADAELRSRSAKKLK